MSSTQSRRATTLSISLPPKLASEVSVRVESGLYTSASELIREALRMLLRSEAGQLRDPLGQDTPQLPDSAVRFASASALMDAGLAMRAQKEEPLKTQLQSLGDAQEAGPGIRIASDRLSKLKIDEPS
ncbi:MAG: ribbon-helix-helix protein, CopG family [bacterium]|nr:ribbon-helix-helix protein, CopG family [bacterium]